MYSYVDYENGKILTVSEIKPEKGHKFNYNGTNFVLDYIVNNVAYYNKEKLNPTQKWVKRAMAVEFDTVTIVATSESQDTAVIKFDNLKTGSIITGVSVNFNKDEIPDVIRLLQEFYEKCY